MKEGYKRNEKANEESKENVMLQAKADGCGIDRIIEYDLFGLCFGTQKPDSSSEQPNSVHVY